MKTCIVIGRLTVATVLLIIAITCDAACGQKADTVLTNGIVFTVNEKRPKAEAVAIRDGKFLRVGSNEDLKALVDHDTDVVDLRGMSVLPGIVDTHIHLMSWVAKDGKLATRVFFKNQVRNNLSDCLRHGVTTIKSLGDPIDLALEARDNLRTKQWLGPRLLIVGPIFTSPGGHPVELFCGGDLWCRTQFCIEVDNDVAARQAVQHLANKGVDAIKMLCDDRSINGIQPSTKLKKAVMRSIINEAHRQGLRATVHAVFEADMKDAIDAGADGVEHGTKELITDNRLASLFVKKNSFFVPTLAISENSSLTTDEMFANKMKNLRRLYERGVTIAVGSDTAYERLELGTATIREMELMVQAGMPPTAVIRAGTRDAAEHLGLLDQIGTIEPGKVADLVVVDGNPLSQISALRKVERVMQSGKTVYQRQ